MIKCNHCGNMTPPGAVCQSCGMPLSGAVDTGFSSMPEPQDQVDQVALPAWLESLRAGERSAAPINNAAPFSAPNFGEEGSLPSWMRPEHGEGSGNTGVNPVVSAYPGQGAASPPAQSITPQSLVDENALPPWLREGRMAPSQPSSPQPVAPQPPPSQPIQASSLVQQEDVPEWMKTLQPQSPASFTSGRQPQPRPAAPSQPSMPVAGMSAHDLIDPQAVPDWMRTQGNQSGVPAPQNRAQDASMGRQPSTQAPQRNSGQPPQGQATGFSAASLLDENALPQWMRESGSNAGQSAPRGASGSAWGNNVPAPSYPSASNTGTRPSMQDSPWSPQLPPQTPLNGSPAQQGQGMAASSFIDEEALPPWLRSADQQRGAAGGSQMGSQVQQNPPIAPRHADSARTQSPAQRKRHERYQRERRKRVRVNAGRCFRSP